MPRLQKAARKAARVARENAALARRSRDPQKEALYDWEDEWKAWNVNSISLAHCRRIIRTACRYFKVQVPKVRQHKEWASSWCIPEYDTISMQGAARGVDGGGKNPATAIHEATHQIVWKIYGDKPHDHGPTFLGIYMWLLEKARIAPATALHASARAHGLKWRELNPLRCRKN